MLRTHLPTSPLFCALAATLLLLGCDDDPAASTENTSADAGSDTGANAGPDTGADTGSNPDSGGTTGEERERPSTPPAAESTPPTTPGDRVAEASQRAVRDAAENRTPAVVPDESAQPFDDETVEIAAELIEYCWDACDLTDICLDAPTPFRSACYADCVDDLDRVLSDLTADDDGKDCLDAVVESLFCETSFESDTIVGVCDEYENDVLAQSGVCEPEYNDVDFYCESYDDVLTWFFEDDTIGGGNLLPDEVQEEDFSEELALLLAEVTSQCEEECYSAEVCLELDASITEECVLDCSDEEDVLVDGLSPSDESSVDCLDAAAEYYDCRLSLTCDDLIDEDEGAEWYCGLEYGEIEAVCSDQIDF